MSSRVVASRTHPGVEALAPLLAESQAQARERELEVVRRVTGPNAPPLILFGAGSLGRRMHAALGAVGARPLAFADNDRRLWGARVDGTAVIAPAEAAARHASEALFVVTIFNPDHAFADTAKQLHEYGCREAISWIRLAWGLEAAGLLPHYAAGRPSEVLAEAETVGVASEMWSDDASAVEFTRQVRWRLSGDFADLSAPRPDQYFPPDLLTLRPGEVFVDCGAFDGDTLRQLVARCPGFASVDAFEPDVANFAALRRCVAKLGPCYGSRVRLHCEATGRRRGVRRFDGEGTSGALVDTQAEAAVARDAGPGLVQCVRLDEALRDVPVTFIKMDVEGAEADTLRGAQRLLRERRPVLAVSAYHHQADLWRLPTLLASLTGEGYRFSLRAHGPDGFECVLYGVPAERSPQ
jgi:FkbM family methyltransferase